jgi:acetyl-CoA decarbonylase/synthase complex subunit delta
MAKAVCEAVTAAGKPLAIMGCKEHRKGYRAFCKDFGGAPGQKRTAAFRTRGKLQTVGASAIMAYGQKVAAESSVDINLAKQLNVLISQLGIQAGNTVMNLGSAAAGYGFEYVASTMDRVKSAALTQNDAMLQMPVVTPVGSDAWSVKEALLDEADMPEWGSREERGIQMEIVTAAACLASGSDAVILRHPKSVKTISELILALK